MSEIMFDKHRNRQNKMWKIDGSSKLFCDRKGNSRWNYREFLTLKGDFEFNQICNALRLSQFLYALINEMKIVHLFIIFIVLRWLGIMFYLGHETRFGAEKWRWKKCFCWVASEKLFCDKRTWSESVENIWGFANHHEDVKYEFIVCGHDFFVVLMNKFPSPPESDNNEQFIKFSAFSAPAQRHENYKF